MDRLYLGVGREIITPKVGGGLCGYSRDIFSESVADDLNATAFYFRQGQTQALMMSLTVCNVRITLAEEILEEIEKRYSIPKECCTLSCVHTHSGPNSTGCSLEGTNEMRLFSFLGATLPATGFPFTCITESMGCPPFTTGHCPFFQSTGAKNVSRPK